MTLVEKKVSCIDPVKPYEIILPLYPSFCTQAVLAPPVEWFLFSGIILHEKYKSPMFVDVSSDNSIRIAKRLCMRNANTGYDIGAVDIELFVCDKYVVISFN